MKTNHIYEITLWGYLQKLFKSKGDSLLLISTIVLTVIIVAVNAGSLSAQSKDKGKTELKQVPEIKKWDVLPDAVQDMPLELQYFDGRESIETSFRAMKEKIIQLLYWDSSYADHYTDLKKIYAYKSQEIPDCFVILVVNNQDKKTLKGLQAALDRFKKEYQQDLDIPVIMGDPNLGKIFKREIFPKYVQINQNGLFVSEIRLDELLTDNK